MRILHTLAERSLGGLEFRTLEQASWLHLHGYEVAIASPSGSAVSHAAREPASGCQTISSPPR